MDQNLLGWIVGWPHRLDKEDDERDTIRDYCGYAQIVGGHGDHFIARVIDDSFPDEPPYHISICLHDGELRFFPTEEAYLAWLGYWRTRDEAEASEGEALRWTTPKGRA